MGWSVRRDDHHESILTAADGGGVTNFVCEPVGLRIEREPLSELNGQLHLCSMPRDRRPLPLIGNLSQREPDQLGGRRVARKVPLVANRLAHGGGEQFDDVGGVDDL